MVSIMQTTVTTNNALTNIQQQQMLYWLYGINNNFSHVYDENAPPWRV